MPFKSKKQQRWAFVNKMKFAHRWAHETGEGGSKKHPKGSKASRGAYARLPTRARGRKKK